MQHWVLGCQRFLINDYKKLRTKKRLESMGRESTSPPTQAENFPPILNACRQKTTKLVRRDFGSIDIFPNNLIFSILN
jgi:hypothetical protein